MDEGLKEVRYDLYCIKCKHWGKFEDEDPCDSCLEASVALWSRKPLYFEEEGRSRNDTGSER